LTAYATVVTAPLVVYFLIGTSEIYVDGPPTPAERVVLTVIVLALPLAAFVGWMVSRLHTRRAQIVVPSRRRSSRPSQASFRAVGPTSWARPSWCSPCSR